MASIVLPNEVIVVIHDFSFLCFVFLSHFTITTQLQQQIIIIKQKHCPCLKLISFVFLILVYETFTINSYGGTGSIQMSDLCKGSPAWVGFARAHEKSLQR